jgi:uncharacterized protein (TIGR04255 family)
MQLYIVSNRSVPKAVMSNAVPKPPYPKAPIIEAVIHISAAAAASPDELQKLVKRFAQNYPHEETLSSVNVAINTTGGAMTVQQQTQGYRVRSADQADIVLIFADGVAASRLSPYPGWEHLREHAHAAWSEWRRILKQSVSKRIGIRYINRIDVPIKAEGIEIDDYLRFSARIPDFSRRPLNGFMLQATKPTDVEHWSVTITSYVASPPPLIDHASLVLDIDVFRTEQITSRDADLWDCIDAVRPLKNAIFEACVTDNARKLFA